MNFIPAELLEYPGDGVHYYQGKPFTGIAFTLRKDGFEKSRVEYKDGLRSGQTTEWYGPGIPMVEANHLRGVVHGRAKEWREDG